MDHQPAHDLNGVLVLDKPSGVTSAGAVELVKRRLRVRRAGHAGTLDPIATGVLPICLGLATKLAAYLLADDKEYEVELVLGVETDTLDRAGTVIAGRDPSGVTRAQLEAALAGRRGEQDQVPPMYSAIKQGGVRLYERARAGVEVAREARRIRIDRLELIDWQPPRVRLAIACSKGTYVRSVVGDLGRELGCGAHVAELRRTRCGAFTLAQAVAPDHVASARLVGMVEATRLPVVPVGAEVEPKIRAGLQDLVGELAGAPEEGVRFQVVGSGDRLLAIARVEAGRVLYDRVFSQLIDA